MADISDIETCTEYGGSVKVIACIEDPVVIKKILTHLKEKATSKQSIQLPESLAPSQVGFFDYKVNTGPRKTQRTRKVLNLLVVFLFYSRGP